MTNLTADFEAELRAAHDQLNSTYAMYERRDAGLSSEHLEIGMQLAIFNYELNVEMAGFVRNRPSAFAQSVALKGLVHKLFEYDQLLSSHLVRRLDLLAKASGVAVASVDLKTERKKWKEELKKLKGWSSIRNSATGHYDKDTSKQVALVKALSANEVLEVALAFLRCHRVVATCCANVGSRRGA